MIKYFSQLLVIFIIGSTVYSCSNYEPTIDPELIPYFDRFADEAALRGVVFDYEEEEYEGFICNIEDILGEDGILGYCQRVMVRQPYPSIYLDRAFWDAATDLQKEYVVFHELGHCFLDRDHPSPVPVDSLGNCMTMMAAGNASCNGINVYDTDRRQMLLDELFSN